MSLINKCQNTAAEKLVEPYLSGMEVGWINRFYEKLDNYTYEQLTDYAAEVHDVRLQTIIDMVGDQLKETMRK